MMAAPTQALSEIPVQVRQGLRIVTRPLRTIVLQVVTLRHRIIVHQLRAVQVLQALQNLQIEGIAGKKFFENNLIISES